MAKLKKEAVKVEEKELKKKEKSIKENKKDKKKDNKKEKKSEKKSLWVRFRIFCHGVKSETIKIHWPVKKDMARYSVATIFFIVFCSLFFYLIDVIFAMIQLFFK